MHFLQTFHCTKCLKWKRKNRSWSSWISQNHCKFILCGFLLNLYFDVIFILNFVDDNPLLFLCYTYCTFLNSYLSYFLDFELNIWIKVIKNEYQFKWNTKIPNLTLSKFFPLNIFWILSFNGVFYLEQWEKQVVGVTFWCYRYNQYLINIIAIRFSLC